MESGDYDKQAIGRRIAAARREAGYTQAELADLVGVKQRAVQAWEYGRTNPYRRLRQLEQVLGRSRAWILRGEEGEISEPERAKLDFLGQPMEPLGTSPAYRAPPVTPRDDLSALLALWPHFRRLVERLDSSVARLEDDVSQLQHAVEELKQRQPPS